MSSEDNDRLVQQLARLVAASAYAAYVNTLVGNPCKAVAYYKDRMTKPQPGDLVLETTNWKADPLDRIGRLVSSEMENPPPEVVDPDTYDESEWGKPYPPHQQQVWRIKTLDGREYRWWNADFIVIPEDPFKHQGRMPT